MLYVTSNEPFPGLYDPRWKVFAVGEAESTEGQVKGKYDPAKSKNTSLTDRYSGDR